MFVHHVSFDLQHFGLAPSAPHSTSVGVLANKASVRNYTADDTHESSDKTPQRDDTVVQLMHQM
jgi:hypothetical protein